MKNVFESVLITGGGGMLAYALKRLLGERGVAFHAVSRQSCDIRDDASLAQLFQTHRPTLVLNCAAYTKVDLAEKNTVEADAINGHAAGALARLCQRWGARLVHYSTDFVFDGTSDRPYRTDDPTNPLSAYGRSKRLGETEVAKVASVDALVLRTAWLYGPGGPCFPATMIKAARAGKSLKVVADQTGAPTYTFDLAQATLELLDHNAPAGTYHVTNAGQTTWFDFTRAILETFGLKAELSPTTSEEWFKIRPDSAVRPAYSVLDLTKTTEALGRPMRSWQDGLGAYRREIDANGGLV